MIGEFPNIPRIYTALAEWLACLVIIFPSLTKPIPVKKYGLMLFAGVGQIALQYIAGMLPLFFWVFGMGINILWMYGTVWFLMEKHPKDSLFLTCKAVIIAEFSAAIGWQIYCQFFWVAQKRSGVIEAICMGITFLLIYAFFFVLEKKTSNQGADFRFRNKEIWLAIFTALIIFTISNIGFLLSNTSINIGDSIAIFSIRTFVNLSGICILYLQQIQTNEEYLKRELLAINNMFNSQYEQYVAYKENSDIINRKCHDLKHQIDVIRSESDEEKREMYLAEMDLAVNNFNSTVETGHPVLDTILTRKNLYCLDHGITLSCLVDGRLLSYMNVMDICSLFGNALDNAIESVEEIVDKEKRLVNLRVNEKGRFILIRLDNYSQGERNFVDGIPETTKVDKDSHGYGIKSISQVATQYEGTMTLSHDAHWFTLKVLLPKK